MVQENITYKHSDYEFRKTDVYANAKYEVILSWLAQKDNLTILNAGCGSGEMCVLLAQTNPTWTIDGIDLDQQGLEMSKEIVSALALANVNIYESSIESWAQTQTNKYDVILCTDVLEHIEDDVQAVRDLHTMLAKDGVLYITVPALQAVFGHHDVALGHFRRYNKRSIRASLSNDFKIKRLRYFGVLFIPIAFWYSRLRQIPYPLEDTAEDNLKSKIVAGIIKLEKRVTFPLGISLIAEAIPRS